MTRPPSTTPGLGVGLCTGAVLVWGVARDAVRHSPHRQAMRRHATVVLVPESGVQRWCAALSTIHFVFEWNGVALIVTTR